MVFFSFAHWRFVFSTIRRTVYGMFSCAFVSYFVFPLHTKKLTKTFKNLTPYGWGVKSRWRTTAGGGGGAHLLAMFWSNVLQHQLNYPPSKFTYSRVLRRGPVPRSSHEYHSRAPSPTRQLLQLSINDDVRPVPARPCRQQGQQWRFHAGAWRGAQAPPNRGYTPQNLAGPQTVASPPKFSRTLDAPWSIAS